MHPAVLGEHKRVRKRLITHVAHVPLLARVRLDVAAQAVWIGESLGAHVAAQRFVAGVDAHVRREDIGLVESLAAGGADVAFVAPVFPDVTGQTARF